jgi:hypothetical protein
VVADVSRQLHLFAGKIDSLCCSALKIGFVRKQIPLRIQSTREARQIPVHGVVDP